MLENKVLSMKIDKLRHFDPSLKGNLQKKIKKNSQDSHPKSRKKNPLKKRESQKAAPSPAKSKLVKNLMLTPKSNNQRINFRTKSNFVLN